MTLSSCKKILIIISLSVFLVSFSGCSVSREINELLLVNALGIDKEGNNYKITIQVMDPKNLTSKALPSSDVTTYTESDYDILGAFKKLTSRVPKKIYTSNLNLLLLGEEFASEGVYDALDFLIREHNLRASFLVAIAKNSSAQDFLQIMSSQSSKYSARFKDSLILTEKTWSPVFNYTLYPFADCLLRKDRELTLPGLEFATSNSPLSLSPPFKVSTMGVFKDDRLLGWLSSDESVGVNFVNNTLNKTFLNVSYNNTPVSIDIYDSSSQIKFSREDDALSFNVNIDCFGSINAVNGNVNWIEPEIYLQLQDSCNRRVKQLATDAFDKAQLIYGADIFGLGETVNINDSKYWKIISNDWGSIFQNVKINVSVNTKIDRSDKILKRVKDR